MKIFICMNAGVKSYYNYLNIIINSLKLSAKIKSFKQKRWTIPTLQLYKSPKFLKNYSSCTSENLNYKYDDLFNF